MERFDAAMKKVDGCRACKSCYKTGKACSFDDDFNEIAPSILEADGIVFTMPVYWFTMPAQIKAVLDKMYSFCVAGKEIGGKECALIACCEDEDVSVLEGVRFPYERTAQFLNWKSVGEVMVAKVNDIGDIDNTDGCKQAAALADKF